MNHDQLSNLGRSQIQRHRDAALRPLPLHSQFTIYNLQFTIILVLLIAAFFRLVQLPTLPPGLNFDEAGSGVAALEVLSGAPRLWWRLGGGQEPFWPYLTALSTAIFGQTPLALRLPAALAGILTVAAVYPLLLKLLTGQKPRDRYLVAVLTALGLALSDWHLHFSRLGFRAILLPLFSTLAFYFFWCSLRGRSQAKQPEVRRNGQISRFMFHVLPAAPLAVSAFFTALAIYSYLAARLLWLVPILFLGLQGLIAKIRPPSQLPEVETRSTMITPRPFLLLISYFLSLLLFLSPLILYFLLNPADFVARSTTLSIFNPQWNQGDLTGAAWRTLVTTLGTFVGLTGDPNPLVNLPFQPALPLFLVPFFLTGLLTGLYHSIRQPPPPCPPASSPHLFLLCWWSIMLLPAILAPEGAPHHLRLIGTIVPTYALVALGLVAVINFLSTFLSFFSRLSYLLPGVCYLLVGLQTYTNYFIHWPASVDFTLPFDLYAVHLADDIAHAPPHVAYVLPMDVRAGVEARHYTLDYLLGLEHPAYTYLPVDEHNAAALLTQAARDKTELRVVRWTQDKHHEADAKELVTYLLETTARLQQRDSFPVYDLETYLLPTTQTVFSLPAINRPLGLNFTQPDTGKSLLQLEAAFVPKTTLPGRWLPIALTLAPLAPMETDYKISLRLLGPAEERLAQKDRVLLHNFHQGTSLWPAEPVNEYYLLAVPPQTPPGDYTAAVVIYHPDTTAPLLVNGLVEAPIGIVRIE